MTMSSNVSSLVRRNVLAKTEPTYPAAARTERSIPLDSEELVKAIAMDIGKDTVAYIEVMYPRAIEATSSTFKLSIRNHIYNEIMAAIKVNDEGQVIARLKDRKAFRRWWVGVHRKIRKNSSRKLGTD